MATSSGSDFAALKPFIGLLIALWIAEITATFESAMIAAAIRYIIEDFGDPTLVGWLTTAYAIVGAVSAALIGRIGDLFGRQRVMVIVLVIALVGSIISAVAQDFTWLLVGRVLQGATGAILPLCIGIVRENLPEKHVPLGIGLILSGAAIGAASGLVFGGWIADTFGWTGVFNASAVYCAVTVLSTILFIPRSPRVTHRIKVEWLSGVLFAPGVMLVLYYASTIPKGGFFDSVPLVAFGAGVLLLALWWHRSLTAQDPLIDVRQFRNRHVLVASAVTALVALSSFQVMIIFSILLQAPLWTGLGLGVSALIAGLVYLPSNLLSGLAGPLTGWLTGRGGGRASMLAGGCLATLGWIAAYFFHDSVAVVTAILCVVAFGTTMLFSVAPTIVAGAVPQDRTSEVTGMLSVVRGMVSGIGALMVTSLLTSDVVHDPATQAQFPTLEAYRLTILVVILFSVLATLCAFALPKPVVQAKPAPAV